MRLPLSSRPSKSLLAEPCRCSNTARAQVYRLGSHPPWVRMQMVKGRWQMRIAHYNQACARVDCASGRLAHKTIHACTTATTHLRASWLRPAPSQAGGTLCGRSVHTWEPKPKGLISPASLLRCMSFGTHGSRHNLPPPLTALHLQEPADEPQLLRIVPAKVHPP